MLLRSLSMHSVLITGPIGAGKSTALAIFADLGWLVLAADDVVADLQAPGGAAYKAIVQRFPAATQRDSEGELQLNRAHLREIVFSDPDEKLALETILHPLVRSEINSFLETNTNQSIAVEIPLISPGSPYLDMFDQVISITAPESAIQRKAGQTQIELHEVARIRQSQPKQASYIAVADLHILNEGDQTELTSAIERFVNSLG